MYRKKIYVIACVYTIFSRFIQTETQFIHFTSVCISEKGEGGERDSGEWRARSGKGETGEQKYMYLYNFLCFIQLETIFIHLCLYKKWGSEREIGGEWRARYLWERRLTIFCKRLLWSTIKSNPSYSIYFRLLVCYYI